MVTKNGSLIMNKCNVGNLQIGVGELKTLSGNTNIAVVSRATYNFTEFQTSGMASAGMKIIIGVGDTEPTFNDYCLDETEVGGVDISTLISTANSGISFDEYGQYHIAGTFTNISNQNVTLREIGVVACRGSGANYDEILIARSVIPAKTLAPSDAVTLTYTISPLQI